MAVSKAFEFTPEEQAAAEFGLAFAHPARVVILRRLLNGGVLSFMSLIEGVPLTKPTMNQHVAILKRIGMIEPTLMENNLAGYCLNYEVYRRGANATRAQFRTATTVPLQRLHAERV